MIFSFLYLAVRALLVRSLVAAAGLDVKETSSFSAQT